MRKIKFRVWCKTSKRFHYDWQNIIISHNQEILDPLDDKLLVWQQYTGLKDKNDQEIYEDDIIVAFDRIYVIKWIKAYNSKCFSAVQPDGKLFDFYGGLPQQDNMEIVGNICESPEKLEMDDSQ